VTRWFDRAALTALVGVVCLVGAAGASPQGDRPFVAGAGALLRVVVPSRPDLTNTYRVDPAGMLVLPPPLGAMSVQGLTLREVADQIAGRLRGADGKTPKVAVTFDRSIQSAFVAGQVRAPGLIAMNGPLSLMKVLARAGSPTAAAGDTIVIIHDEVPDRAGAAPHETRSTVALADLRAGHDVLLHDGDTVFVPKADVFYILGEVQRPGQYILTPGMTVLQAIALAGGLTPRGSDRRVAVIRSIDGRATELDVDAGRAVLPDDTIRVRARLF